MLSEHADWWQHKEFDHRVGLTPAMHARALAIVFLGAVGLTLAGCSEAVRWDATGANWQSGSGPYATWNSWNLAPELAVDPLPRPDHYTVASGDTLYSIAWRHRLDWRELASWNRLARAD